MKKLLKPVFALFIALILFCSAFCINAFAAGSVIKFSSSKVNVGDTVKVTVSFNSDIEVVTSSATISYDSSILKLVSSTDKYSGGSGVLMMAHIGNEQTFEFKAIKAGSCTFKTYDCLVSDGGSEVSVSGDTATLSVVDKTLSSNANLKSLRVSAGSLTPSFSKDVTSYNITIGPDVEQLTVGANTEDPDASVEVQGSKTMKFGENVRVVVVTAPNGSTKKYTLNITKLDKDTTSSEPEITTKPQVTVGGEVLYVTDVDSDTTVPGFTHSDYNFKGTTVKALTDDSTVLIKLVDFDGVLRGLYIYDAVADTAQKFEYLMSEANMYLLLTKDDSVAVPNGFTETEKQINGVDCAVYVCDQNDELYLVYAKYKDSEPTFYLYDTAEGTLQRYFGNLGTSNTDVSTNTEPEPDEQNFFEKFLESKNNRLILIGAAVVLGLVVLVLIIVLMVKSSKYEDDDEDDDQDEPFDYNFDNK